MILEKKFVEERETYTEHLAARMSCLGGLNHSKEMGLFYTATSTLGCLAQTGEYDPRQSIDLIALSEITETILSLMHVLHSNLSDELPEGAVAKFEQDIISGAFYLALFLAEEEEEGFNECFQFIFNDYAMIFKGIAACVGLKPSTLKNHLKIGDLENMSRQDLVNWLQKQDRFKHFSIVDRRLSETPFDCSNIRYFSEFISMLEVRAKLFNNKDAWEQFSNKYITNDNDVDDSLLLKMALNKPKLYKLMNAANLDPDTIDEAILTMRTNAKSDIDSAYRSIEMNYRHNLKSTLIERHLDFNERTLFKHLTIDRGLPIDKDDSGKNNYLSALDFKGVTLGIEHLKTPCVWVNRKYINIDAIEGEKYAIYERSEDKSGRHSALKVYPQLAKPEVVKIKVPNSTVLNKLLSAIAIKESTQ
jgi:hypothetical protein